MKIQESLNKSSQIVNRPEQEDKKMLERNDSLFDKHLRKVENNNDHERMTTMLDRITKQGEKLSKYVDIKELRLYKKMISEFLYDAVNYSHKFSKESMLDRRGRHRVYAIISKVNDEMDHLTQEVLKEEKDNIKVLQKLDDIRGLLIDIIM